MHRTALRGLYGSNNQKTKNQAVISPVVEDMNTFEDGDLSTGEEGNGFGTQSHASLRHNSNNSVGTPINNGSAVALKIHDVPEETEYQLQRKSANSTGDAGMLSRFGVGQFFGDGSSNQEQDTFTGPPVGQKYTVLGQKQQWRKSRAGRSRHLQTISPVDDDSRVRDEGDVYSSGRGSTIPSSISSYYESSQGRSSAESYSEGTTSLQGSSGRGSEYFQGHAQHSNRESSSASEDNQRFVVTRQKKSKYSAKLHVHGQKPLYLGRYKNEEAALAACENAYSVISTPRK